MAIFNPVDMMGPAHRGGSIQQMAQAAAQNVMRRQKLRALLQHGAARAGAGGTQPVRSSINARPTGLHGATLHSPYGGANKSLASLLSGMNGVGVGGTDGVDDGSQGASGGGYDYPSIPDNSDHSQSPVSTQPGDAYLSPVDGSSTPYQYGTDPNGSPGLVNPTTGNSPGDPGAQPSPTVPGTGGQIHLGGGLFYDPATDTVHGGNPHGAAQ